MTNRLQDTSRKYYYTRFKSYKLIIATCTYHKQGNSNFSSALALSRASVVQSKIINSDFFIISQKWSNSKQWVLYTTSSYLNVETMIKGHCQAME